MRRPAPYSSTQMPATTPKRRCAVYTRKSTDEGLDMQYNSLEAQRDAGRSILPASARKAGSLWPMVMTMAASRVAIWSGPRCAD